MQDKALQSDKMQDNPAKSRTIGNSALLHYFFHSYIVGALTMRIS